MEFIKTCMEKFNYPHIHSMSDAEYLAVFEIPNRNFLVSWVLKSIDPGYYSDLVENKTDQQLGDVLNSHGFCVKSVKDKFFTGELPNSEQVSSLFSVFL